MEYRRDLLWPRWAVWANVIVAITGAGGVLAVFDKSGALSWNGVLGFWIPVSTFAAGMTMNMVLILRRDARVAARQGARVSDTVVDRIPAAAPAAVIS